MTAAIRLLAAASVSAACMAADCEVTTALVIPALEGGKPRIEVTVHNGRGEPMHAINRCSELGYYQIILTSPTGKELFLSDGISDPAPEPIVIPPGGRAAIDRRSLGLISEDIAYHLTQRPESGFVVGGPCTVTFVVDGCRSEPLPLRYLGRND